MKAFTLACVVLVISQGYAYPYGDLEEGFFFGRPEIYEEYFGGEFLPPGMRPEVYGWTPEFELSPLVGIPGEYFGREHYPFRREDRDLPKEVLGDIPRGVPRDVPRDVFKDIPRDIPKDIPRDVPRDLLRDIPRDVPRGIPGGPLDGYGIPFKYLTGGVTPETHVRVGYGEKDRIMDPYRYRV